MTFRVGGKDMPFGRVELAYTGAGPAEQVRALARLQGRSFICAIHDEVGNHFDAGFIDSAATSNQHLDLDQYIRNIKVAYADDPAFLDAWLHGRLDVDIAGAFFGSSYGVRRSLRDVRPGGIPTEELQRAFVCMDWGCSAPTVAYLCLPEPIGTPKGSIWLLDEFYVAASTSGGATGLDPRPVPEQRRAGRRNL